MNSLISLHNAATTLGANTFKKVQFIEAVLTICIQRVKTIIFWKRSLQTSEDESFFLDSLMQTVYAKLLFVVFFSIF